MEMRDMPRNVPNEVNCLVEITLVDLKEMHVEFYHKKSHLVS